MDGEDKSKLALNILYEFSQLNYSDIQAFVPQIKQSLYLGSKDLLAIFHQSGPLDITKQWVCSKLNRDKCPRYEKNGNQHTYSVTGVLADISVIVTQQPDSIDLRVRQLMSWPDSQVLDFEQPKTVKQLMKSITKAAKYEASYESAEKLTLGNKSPIPFFYREQCFMFCGQLPLSRKHPTPVKIAGEIFNGLPDNKSGRVDRKGHLVTYCIETTAIKPKEYTELDQKFL